MYKLLIVDDESYILDWLYALFKGNNQLDLDIYTAGSGTKALEIIDNTRIDIVITDISMPGMSGLQLLDNLRKSWSKCKVIFLTGMNNFNYVYEAIQYGEVSYLLKTEKDEKIIEAVEKAIKDIEESLELERILIDSRKQVEEAKPLLQREFLQNLLYGSVVYQNAEPLKQLDMALDPQKPTILILCAINNIQLNNSYTERNRLVFAVKLLVNQNIPEYLASVQTIDDQSHLIWFIQSKVHEAVLDDPGIDRFKTRVLIKGVLEKVQDICLGSFKLNVSFGMSDKGVLWSKISEEYARIKSSLYNNKITGKEIVLFAEEYQSCYKEAKPDNDEILPVKLACMKLGQIKTLENYLESGQKERFHLQLSSLIECLRTVQSMYCLPAFELYNSISLMYLSYINRRGMADRIANKQDLQKLVNAHKHSTWMEAVEFLYKIQDEIFYIQNLASDNQIVNVVAHIKSFINDNLGNDLSLMKLADIFHFNSSYLSRLFKTGTGINLSDYIFEKRIEQGKRLLEENRLKVQEIAFAVGYDSPKSFARLFKKSQGVTPQEYRNIYLSHNNMSTPNT